MYQKASCGFNDVNICLPHASTETLLILLVSTNLCDTENVLSLQNNSLGWGFSSLLDKNSTEVPFTQMTTSKIGDTVEKKNTFCLC